MKRLFIVASGRVQGVGFRYFTKDIADELNISGYARNTFEGNVEIEAQGEENSLELFVNRISQGPPLSHVEKCTSSDIPVVSNEKIFIIKH